MIEKIKPYLFYFYIFSFLGWLWEVILWFIMHQEIVNPGTMVGPWLTIYGAGAVLIILIYKKIKNNYIIFIISALLCGIIEYCTALYLDYFHNTKWWDYSNHLLNINGKTSIEVMLLFGIACTLGLKYFFPFLEKTYKKVNTNKMTIFLIIIIILNISDYVYSTIKPNKNNIIQIEKKA